jgi:hypothetical protein
VRDENTNDDRAFIQPQTAAGSPDASSSADATSANVVGRQTSLRTYSTAVVLLLHTSTGAKISE